MRHHARPRQYLYKNNERASKRGRNITKKIRKYNDEAKKNVRIARRRERNEICSYGAEARERRREEEEEEDQPGRRELNRMESPALTNKSHRRDICSAEAKRRVSNILAW